MNSNNFANCDFEKSQRKAAKVAGFIFLFIVLGWILNWTFVDSKLMIAGNGTATVNNIIDNEWLFRVGITNELILSVSGFVLAFALYVMLKPIDRNLALFALLLKMAESIVSTVNILVTFIVLQMLNGKGILTVFKPEQLQDIAGLFFNIRSNGATITMVFLGLGFIVFFYLLYKSKYVPGILAGFGILSYFLILVNSLVTTLIPQNATLTTMVNAISMIFMTPSILFELIIGFWLLFKGIKLHQMK